MSIESQNHLQLTDDDARMAQESAAQLARHLRSPERLRLEIGEDQEPGELLQAPTPALLMLNDILTQVGQGSVVTIMPARDELTTQQAADYLNVSRPYRIGLLERGEIPHRKVGAHRRINFRDLAEYRSRTDVEAREALDELTAEAQGIGLGYL